MRIDVSDSAAISPSVAPVRRPLPARRWRRARAYVRAARRCPTARRSRRVVLLIALLLLISGFDLIFTLLASQTKSFEELNPLAARLIHMPAALVVFKLFLVAAASIILYALRARRLTEWACWGLSGAYAALAAVWWLYYAPHG